MFSAILSFVAAHVLYLALHLETGSFPKPFSARQEQEAFSRFRQGDAKAREEIICRNLRLVAHIAKKYYSSGEDQDDLVSIGTIGLIKAVDSFDSGKGARFATYAARCIENAILTSKRAEQNGTAPGSLEICLKIPARRLQYDSLLCIIISYGQYDEKAAAGKLLFRNLSQRRRGAPDCGLSVSDR